MTTPTRVNVYARLLLALLCSYAYRPTGALRATAYTARTLVMLARIRRTGTPVRTVPTVAPLVGLPFADRRAVRRFVLAHNARKGPVPRRTPRARVAVRHAAEVCAVLRHRWAR